MIGIWLCRIAIFALTCLAAPLGAGAGGTDSAVDPASPTPGTPVEAETPGPSDSADEAETCDCGARSPGELAETQRLMQEWQAQQTP